MNYVYLFFATFFLGLLAAALGMKAAYQISSSTRRPPFRRLALICAAVVLLMYPAMYLALQFEYVVITKRNPGAQAGVPALLIALGVCTLTSMAATLYVMSRSK